MTYVVLDGKPLIAKYCQWDGYLESAGVEQLSFLNGSGFRERINPGHPEYSPKTRRNPTGRVVHFERETFVKNLRAVKPLTNEEVEKRWDACGADGSGWVDMTVSDKFSHKHYHLTRDCTGSETLAMIQLGELPETHLELNFAYDGLFCEWTYVLDLDKNTWEIYPGFNKKRLQPTDRFYSEQAGSIGHDETEYFGPALLKAYSLDKLPNGIDEVLDLVKD